jgi:hypothetical protein
MRSKPLFYMIWLALVGTAFSFGLHSASSNGLLQVPPSFAGNAISLHPALHPDHDPNHLDHLLPRLSKELYYSQEGHRREFHPQ